MPTAKPDDEVKVMEESASLDSVCEGINKYLENERHRVNEEIRSYPTPIPACDAQRAEQGGGDDARDHDVRPWA